MRLLNEALLKRFAEVGRQDGKSDPLVITKFFNLLGRGKWWATEYDPERREFFGYVSIFGDFCDEWGYFSLDELELVNIEKHVGIVRDMTFKERPISEEIPGITDFCE